ncbi:hypothetical protein [Devosia sp.]|uniref:hypothetical protein n=1 Tax=Devosia sp. TaxID=1871048 RepID=UPI001AC28E8B|nr:hypothetical protein [Devosia sp.]MBN9307346.1 hypothetical protein [Devosia sp.]
MDRQPRSPTRCRRTGDDRITKARRLTLVGAVVDQELVYLDRLMSGLIALDQGPLTVPQVFEGLAAYRRAIAILYGRREELRPWGVE